MITNRHFKKLTRSIDEKFVARSIITMTIVMLVVSAQSIRGAFEVVGAIVVMGLLFNIILWAINRA